MLTFLRTYIVACWCRIKAVTKSVKAKQKALAGA